MSGNAMRTRRRQPPTGEVHVGTSGWTYDDWRGRFYPAGVRGPERLAYYARFFDTVEVNASFYRVPTETMVRSWNARLPADFHLVLKGTRLVTHVRRLADCHEELAFFFERTRALRRLRVVLWQLPPSLRRDVALLEGFARRLPDHVRHAVEFRHVSWWEEQVADLLARRNIAFVAVSHPRLPDRIFARTDLVYVRFHGLRRLYDDEYTDEELAEWARRLDAVRAGRSVYAFFNNDPGAAAVRNAQQLRELLANGPPPGLACRSELPHL